MRKKAIVARAHLIETSLPDIDRADLHRHPGWSATIHRCATCSGEGWIEYADYGEPCPVCSGDELLASTRRRHWWSTLAELLAIGATLVLCWAAWTMLP